MLDKDYNLIIYIIELFLFWKWNIINIGYMLFHGIRKNMEKFITYVLNILDISC